MTALCYSHMNDAKSVFPRLMWLQRNTVSLLITLWHRVFHHIRTSPVLCGHKGCPTVSFILTGTRVSTDSMGYGLSLCQDWGVKSNHMVLIVSPHSIYQAPDLNFKLVRTSNLDNQLMLPLWHVQIQFDYLLPFLIFLLRKNYYGAIIIK